MTEANARRISIVERPEISWLSIVLGFGPVSLIVAAAATSLIIDGRLRPLLVAYTIIFAASILAFIAGVRRGLSFRTEDGPTIAQLGTMFVLFAAALAALFGVQGGHPRSAALALIVGFAIAMVADPLAAKTGEAPMFFARLRPWQMALAVFGAVLLSVAA